MTAPEFFEYIEPGVLEEVKPTLGQYGTMVLLKGSDLEGTNGGGKVKKVYIDGVVATIVERNDTYVLARPGRGTAGVNVTVEIESNDGTIARKYKAFEKLEGGEITSALPLAAAAGQEVVITGTNLDGHNVLLVSNIAKFTVAGIVLNHSDPAVVTEFTNKTLKFIVPANQTGKGEIEILMANGAVIDTTIDNAISFEFAAVTAISPDVGQQGAQATITGAGLDAGDGGVSSVTLNGNAAASIDSISADFTEVVVTAGPGPAGEGPVVLTSVGNRSLQSVGVNFTYGPAPTILSVDPTSGQAGTLVTIRGTNMIADDLNYTNALFGGANATFTADTQNASQVIVNIGVFAEGAVSVKYKICAACWTGVAYGIHSSTRTGKPWCPIHRYRSRHPSAADCNSGNISVSNQRQCCYL